MSDTLLTGDALAMLRTLPDASVQVCVTSPPYWGLRDYGVAGQLGAEKLPSEYVGRLVAIFAEVRRVLRDDGTFWLNIGDSYTSGNRTWRDPDKKNHARGMSERAPTPPGLRPKNLVGIPWRVAFALQDDGWNLRSDIVWAKPNPMPESVSDRPTRSHEFIFLFTKSLRYFYDADAIREPFIGKNEHDRTGGKYDPPGQTPASGRLNGSRGGVKAEGRNARSVWTITPKPYKGAHFAVFPPELPRRCILAGSRTGDVVLDPFAGSGTTLAVAKLLGRSYIGIDLNPNYSVLVEQRVRVGA